MNLPSSLRKVILYKKHRIYQYTVPTTVFYMLPQVCVFLVFESLFLVRAYDYDLVESVGLIYYQPR